MSNYKQIIEIWTKSKWFNYYNFSEKQVYFYLFSSNSFTCPSLYDICIYLSNSFLNSGIICKKNHCSLAPILCWRLGVYCFIFERIIPSSPYVLYVFLMKLSKRNIRLRVLWYWFKNRTQYLPSYFGKYSFRITLK